MNMDSQPVTLLVLLGPNVAFDTVDLNVSLNRLRRRKKHSPLYANEKTFRQLKHTLQNSRYGPFVTRKPATNLGRRNTSYFRFGHHTCLLTCAR